MAARTVDYWISMFNLLKQERVNKDQDFQELAEYFAPWKSNFCGPNADTKRTNKIFNSKPVNLLNQAVAKIHTSLIGSSTDWFSLELDDEDLSERRVVAEWLDKCERMIYRTFNRSNFEAESFQTIHDLILFGNGGLFWTEPDEHLFPGQITFRPRQLSGLYFIENSLGLVDTALYKFGMIARDILENYPRTAKRSDKIMQQIEKNPYERMNILHIVAPKKDDPVYTSEHAYTSLQILIEDQTLLNEHEDGQLKGFEEFPYVVSRGFRFDDSQYGYSMSMVALPDAKSKNLMWELFLKALSKDVDPPLIAQSDSMVSRIQMGANRINWVKPGVDPSKALTQVTSNRRMDTMAFADQSINTNMGEMFQENLNFTSDRSGPNMSTREVDAIENRKNEVLSPILGRHNYEFVGPLVMSVFYMLHRRGMLPPTPREVVGHFLSAKAVGPLFQAQRMRKVFGMEDMMTYAQQMAGTNPEIAAALNGDFIVRTIARIKDVPPGAVKTEKEMDQWRDNIARQEQMEQGLQNADTGASAVAKLRRNA